MELYPDIHKVEFLFRKYYKVLLAYAIRFTNDKYQAENIVQDVFFELWSKRESLDFDLAIKSYLFTSVYNRSLNYVNSLSVSRKTSLDNLDEEYLLTGYFVSQDKAPEYWLMLNELDVQIKELIDQLPTQCRKVFLLSRQDELKNKEIAGQLGISVKAVEKHISRALAFLRENLKERG